MRRRAAAVAAGTAFALVLLVVGVTVPDRAPPDADEPPTTADLSADGEEVTVEVRGGPDASSPTAIEVEVRVADGAAVGAVRLAGVVGDGWLALWRTALTAEARQGGSVVGIERAGPAIGLRATGFTFTSVEVCLPVEATRSGPPVRLLHVEDAAPPTVEDVTVGVGGAEACGRAASFSRFGPGRLRPVTAPGPATTLVPVPPAAVPTTSLPVVAGPLPAPTLSPDDPADPLPPGPPLSTTTLAPPTTLPPGVVPPDDVLLSTDLPASGVVLDLRGAGPGTRAVRCVAVVVQGRRPSQVRAYLPPTSGSSTGVLASRVLLTLEDGVDPASCADPSAPPGTQARRLIGARPLSEAVAEHDAWTSAPPGWSAPAGGGRRIYRVVLEVPATGAVPAEARLSQELRWEVR